MRRPRSVVLVVCAIGVLAAVAAGSSAATRRPFPLTTCFWTQVAASGLHIGPNIAFPDSGAVYWSAQFSVPAGARIVLKGQFVHARYESLNSYDVATRGPIDALNDVSTRPDRGSTNPFRVGANRTAARRSYTITMYNAPLPIHKAPNSLYAGMAGQTEQILLYRVYEPDSFTRAGLTGDVALPAPRLQLANGSVQTGSAACQTLHAQHGRLPLTTAPKSLYTTLRDQPGKPATFPAGPTPAFRAYYNTQFSIDCGYYNRCSGHPARIGGQYSNVDNQYVGASVSRGFAAGPVLVLRGRLPTTPVTGRHVNRMGTGQLRYWSMCQNESLYTTAGAGCVYDSEIPVDRRHEYTIITSTRQDRPRNATRRCGVAWIPWPKRGDGDGHLKDGLLIVRNMLPAPGFRHAIQDTRTPGDEQRVLGSYYPRGTYTTRTAFQKRGCRA